MTLVATLISAPSRPAVSRDVIGRALGILTTAEQPVWLANGVAADIEFQGDAGDCRVLADRIRAALAGLPIDVVVQPAATRAKALLIADMDSTMIGQECIDELAAEIGIRDHIAAITERAMRGEIEFEPALRERVALLKGLAVTVVPKVIAERITLTPGARILVQTMRAHGAYTALVSGGFTLFTRPIAERIGFHENRANRLIEADGALAGLVEEPILGADAKRMALLDLSHSHDIAMSKTLAVGDGVNDLPMIQLAGLGVAFRAKPKVAAEAAARIEHGDLTALLFCQGIKAAAFVTD